MPVDRRLLMNIDWVLVAACFILCAIGVATMRMTTRTSETSINGVMLPS